MEKISKKQSLTSKFFSIEKINPFFSKVKIYVMYEGFNRNGSYMNRDTINRAIHTLYNIPIVGEYLADKENFGGHGASVVKNEQGDYELVLSTRPYGVVPESAQVYWETVVEDNGLEREYLVVDGAYLWTGRYPELNTILDEGYYGQSMEIELVNANYSIINGQEVLNIQDFVFTAFCLLGIDKDSDMFGHVPPAFESSKVVAYSLDKELFESQFNQMIYELKSTLKEGGIYQMAENLQPTQETNAQDELKKRLDETATTTVEEPVVDDVEQEEQEEKLEETHADIQETVEPTLTEVETKEEPELEIAETEVATTEEAIEEVVETETEATEATESTDGETTFSITEEEYNTLKTNFEALEVEVAELRSYKRNRELEDLQNKFSAQVSEQELKQVIEKNPDATIEKLEIEIFALIGKKNYSLESKTKRNKVSIVSPKVENESNPYGDIFN